MAIARGYLWPRQRERNGLREDEVEIGDDVLIGSIVTEYTREAGVRGLERELGTLLRKTATKIAPGKAEAPVNGGKRRPDPLRARTAEVLPGGGGAHRRPGSGHRPVRHGSGGDAPFIEATSMKGKEGFVLTGQLGDVMKESARIALFLRPRP